MKTSLSQTASMILIRKEAKHVPEIKMIVLKEKNVHGLSVDRLSTKLMKLTDRLKYITG